MDDVQLELEERLVAKAALYKIPLTANFELTPECTLRCNMCFVQMGHEACQDEGGVRSLDSWLNIAGQFRQMGCLFILLTGGEPLLYPHFWELYDELRRMGFVLTINTNGTLLTEEAAQRLAENKPRRVNVTLYGVGRDTYHRLCHNPDAYEKTIQAVRFLKQKEIDTKLNISVVRENLVDYDSLLSMATDWGIPVVVNSYMFPALRSHCKKIRNVDSSRIAPSEAAECEVKYWRHRYGEDFLEALKEREEMMAQKEYKKGICLDCRAGSSSCWVNWQQKMTPCVLMESPQVDLNMKSVSDAWAELQNRCASLSTHNNCVQCKLRAICEVCYAAVGHEMSVRGNLSYLCQMTQKKKEIMDEILNKE